MIITNKHNLPQPYVDLATDDNYDPGQSDYTTTTLIGPPKIRQLSKRHYSEIEEDVIDRFWSIMGSAKHYCLEQIAKKNPDRYVAEERYYIEIDGLKIGGQIDLYDKENQTLYDWKEVRSYKIVNGDFFDWIAQANINKYLCEQNGLVVKYVEYIALIRDWSALEAEKNPGNYPHIPVYPIQLPQWKEEETRAYLNSRIQAHEAAKACADDDIPICTEKERWKGNSVFAVKKKKEDARAVANGRYGTYEEALTHAQKIGGVVESRLGEDKRCLKRCKVRKWCNYGRTLQVS